MKDLRRSAVNQSEDTVTETIETEEVLKDDSELINTGEEDIIVLSDDDIIDSDEDLSVEATKNIEAVKKSKKKKLKGLLDGHKNEVATENYSHAIRTVKEFDDMGIREIESYGRSIQDDISGSMDDILNKSRMIDTGDVGDKLNELSIIANRTTRSFGSGLLPVIKVQKFLGRYTKVDEQLEHLADGITEYQEKLNTTLDGLLQSRGILMRKVEELEVCQDELSLYCDKLKKDDTTDGIRLQAVANRLKIISTLKATAEQSLASTVLLIKENKEIANQMEDTVTNVVPMFKMQLVNALSIKTHKESLAFKKRVGKVANELVLSNARDIKDAADEMIENRTDSIILPETIFEANKKLQETVKRVVESSTSEVDKNLEVVSRIKAASSQLKEMMNGNLIETDASGKMVESKDKESWG